MLVKDNLQSPTFNSKSMQKYIGLLKLPVSAEVLNEFLNGGIL